MEKVLGQQHRIDELKKIFEAYDDDMDGRINLSFIIDELKLQGFKIMDEPQRFKEIREFISELPLKSKTDINFSQFKDIILLEDGDFVERALLGKLILPDFYEFTESIKRIYKIVETIDDGENASYIPQLAEVDPNLFAIAACTVDGQQCDIGDSDHYF